MTRKKMSSLAKSILPAPAKRHKPTTVIACCIHESDHTDRERADVAALLKRWHELMWALSCPLVSTVRSVEEHVEGFDQRWSLPGGGAGQPNRRGLDRPPRKIKHAAPHLRSGVHGSVRVSSLSYVSSTCLTRINSARFVPLFDT